MTTQELENTTTDKLIEQLDYCGYDNYYRTYRDEVIHEITKRLNRKSNIETFAKALIAQIEAEEVRAKAMMSSVDKCDFLKGTESAFASVKFQIEMLLALSKKKGEL